MTDLRPCPRCGVPLADDAPSGLCPKCLVQAGFESANSGGPSLAATAASPSLAFVPPTVAEMARRFPQLEIIELVGKGGMGAVYKARQPGLDRLVAVKILPPQVGADPSFAERFQREARLLAKLNHPNIVGVHDFGKTDGLYYFVMEYIHGANLRQTIRAGQIAPEQALAIVPQVCDALQYAHDEGVVHRDIKPENILLDTKGRVKIADFGLSKLLGEEHPDQNLTGTHEVMGTLRYMAPEQLQGTKTVDHRADIFSLGVVFYELLTGDIPMGRFAPPSQRVQIDVRLDEVVLRTLEAEPAKRYQRAGDVKTDVETVRSSSQQPRAVPAAPLDNSAADFSIQLLPRDGTDAALFLTVMLPWVTGLSMAFPGLLIALVTAALTTDELALGFGVAGGLLIGLIATVVLAMGSVHSVRVDSEGLTIHPLIGPSKFLPWGDVRRIERLERWEAIRRVWLWPGLPPRGSILSMTARDFYRIDCQGDCWYFAPPRPAEFLDAVARAYPRALPAGGEKPAADDGLQDARDVVAAPATAMMMFAIVQTLTCGVLLAIGFLYSDDILEVKFPPALFGGPFGYYIVAGFVAGLVVFEGSRRMFDLSAYPFVVLAALVAGLPWVLIAGFVFAIPMMIPPPLLGLWLLLTLTRPEIRGAFYGIAPPAVPSPSPGVSRVESEPPHDPSGFVCAIIGIVLFALGLIVPAILIAFVHREQAFAVVLAFVISMVLALIFGLIGHKHALGRWTAGGVLVVAFLTIGGASLYWISSSASRGPLVGPVSLPPTVGRLQGQWDAALALTNSDARDDALAALAIEASLGTLTLDPDFARELSKEAAVEIRNPTKRDESLASCARNLARRGHPSEAALVAKLIGAADNREATLAEIATGQPPAIATLPPPNPQPPPPAAPQPAAPPSPEAAWVRQLAEQYLGILAQSYDSVPPAALPLYSPAFRKQLEDRIDYTSYRIPEWKIEAVAVSSDANEALIEGSAKASTRMQQAKSASWEDPGYKGGAVRFLLRISKDAGTKKWSIDRVQFREIAPHEAVPPLVRSLPGDEGAKAWARAVAGAFLDVAGREAFAFKAPPALAWCSPESRTRMEAYEGNTYVYRTWTINAFALDPVGQEAVGKGSLVATQRTNWFRSGAASDPSEKNARGRVEFTIRLSRLAEDPRWRVDSLTFDTEPKPILAKDSPLARRVGTWKSTKTIVVPRQGETVGQKIDGESSSRFILGGQFLETDVTMADGSYWTVIEGYDADKNQYPTWVFSPKGPIVESIKQWNELTQTFEPVPALQKPSEPTVTSRYPAADRCEGVFINRDPQGRVTSEATHTATRTSAEPKLDLLPKAQTHAHPAAAHQILALEVGEWEGITDLLPSAATPKEMHTRCRIVRTWALGGRFVRSDLADAGGDYQGLTYLTFDEATQKFRAWDFDSLGGHSTGSGTQGANPKVVNWELFDPKNDPKNPPGQCITTYDGPDRLRFSIRNRSAQGELFFGADACQVRAGSEEAKRLALDHWVGEWNVDRGPGQKTQVRGRWILDFRFLELSIIGSDGFQVLVIETYDPRQRKYLAWQFEAEPGGWSHGEGIWNEATQTLAYDLANERGTGKLRFSTQFTGDGTLAITTQQENGPIAPFGTGRRMAPGEKFVPAKAPVGPNARGAPELARLSEFIGEWSGETKDQLAPNADWTPAGGGKKQWVLDGFMIRDESYRPTGELGMLGLWAYDDQAKEYREWYFFANGIWHTQRDKWDDASRSLQITGTTSLGGTYTGTRRLTSPTTYAWSILGKDEAGKAVLDLLGRMTRK